MQSLQCRVFNAKRHVGHRAEYHAGRCTKRRAEPLYIEPPYTEPAYAEPAYAEPSYIEPPDFGRLAVWYVWPAIKSWSNRAIF
jgi:hypothetical protein